MQNERYYSDISKIVETPDFNVANQLLDEGYEVLALKDRTDSTIEKSRQHLVTSFVYVLGLPGVDEKPPTSQTLQTPQKPPTPPAEPKELDSLPWQASSWSDEADSVPPDKVTPAARTLMEQRKFKFSTGKFEYHLTKSGWLNRRELKKD